MGQPSGSDYYVTQDMTIRCWTPSHYAWEYALGIPMVVGYVFGIPAVIFWLLYSNRDKLHTADVKRSYFFFYTVPCAAFLDVLPDLVDGGIVVHWAGI